MNDELRRKVSALWLFHGARIELSLAFAASQMEATEATETDPELSQAAGEERDRCNAALEAFRELGKELQK